MKRLPSGYFTVGADAAVGSSAVTASVADAEVGASVGRLIVAVELGGEVAGALVVRTEAGVAGVKDAAGAKRAFHRVASNPPPTSALRTNRRPQPASASHPVGFSVWD